MSELPTHITLNLRTSKPEAPADEACMAAIDGSAPRKVFVTMMRDYFGIAYPPTGARSAMPTVEDVFAETLLEALEDAYETGFSDGARSVA